MSIVYQQTNRRIESEITFRLDFCKHVHDDIEIVAVRTGHVVAYVDTEGYDLYPGDIFIAFPNKIHSYKSFNEEECSSLVFLSACLFPEYGKILNEYEPVFPVVRKADVPEEARMILELAMRDQNRQYEHKDNILKGYYLIFLGKIFPFFTLKPRKKSDTELLSALLQYCNRNYREEITLDSVAEALHVSKYHISHLFAEKIHIRFNDYIHMLRISDACRKLLSDEMSISKIAHSVGYNSIRSFNRSFIKRTGTTPTKYRAENQ